MSLPINNNTSGLIPSHPGNDYPVPIPGGSEVAPAVVPKKCSDVTEAALEYAGTYELAVFPCRTMLKTPATKHGFKNATKKAESIKSLFQSTHNLAIATGDASGVFVVDVDMPDGFESLTALEAIHGKLPETVRAITPRQGLHYYFAMPEGVDIGTSAGKVGNNIDIRGNGGYVLAAPGETEKGSYEWVEGHAPGEIAFTAAPDWLVALASGAKPASYERLRKPLDNEFEEGTRNDSLWRIACGMRAAGKDESQIDLELQEVNLERCNPPLDETEVKRIAKSATRHPKGDPFADFVPFPYDLLPDPLGSFIPKAAGNIGCDECFLAMPYITALASAIGGSYALKLSSTWSVSPIIWAGVVGKSGTGKSPAFKLATKWLTERESAELSSHVFKMDDYKVKLKDYDLKAKQKDFKGELPPEPVANRLCIGDTTIEALCLLLSKQPHGLVVVKDELATWFESFTRRSNSTSGDSSQWLEMYDGSSLTIDRKTGENKIIHVPRAAVSIVGGIQPEILQTYATNTLVQSGLFARILFAHPPGRITTWGERSEVTEEDIRPINRLFDRIYSLRQPFNDGPISPTELSLIEEAEKVWAIFYDQMQRETDSLEGALNATWSKLIGYAARLALVIHMIRWAAGTDEKPGDVDAESMRTGIELARWFGNEAKRIYKPDRPKKYDVKLLEFIRSSEGSVTPRDLQRRAGYKSAEEAEAALNSLHKAGIGKWCTGPKNPNGGAPPRTYVVEANEYPSVS